MTQRKVERSLGGCSKDLWDVDNSTSQRNPNTLTITSKGRYTEKLYGTGE